MRKLKLLTLILLLGDGRRPPPRGRNRLSTERPPHRSYGSGNVRHRRRGAAAHRRTPSRDRRRSGIGGTRRADCHDAGRRPCSRTHGDRGREQPQPAKTVNQRRAERGISSRTSLFVPKGQWVFGRYGLLFDPQQPRLRRARNRRHHLRRLHLQGQSDDRLRAGQQLDARRALHLRPHAAQTRQGERQLRQRRLVD